MITSLAWSVPFCLFAARLALSSQLQITVNQTVVLSKDSLALQRLSRWIHAVDLCALSALQNAFEVFFKRSYMLIVIDLLIYL